MSDKIRDILLQHKGKANAITSKCISEIMGFPMEDTQYVSRKEILNTVKNINYLYFLVIRGIS